MKGWVARRTREVYVAVDVSKLGVVGGGVWAHGSDKAVLATDLAPNDPALAPFKTMFKEIV